MITLLSKSNTIYWLLCRAPRGGKFLIILLLWGLAAQAAYGQVKAWDKTFGGPARERLRALRQTDDGGYILGGYSSSGVGGDKSEPSRANSDDFWVVKLDAAGNKQWDRTYGGNNGDYLYALQPTRDGGYILGGFSESDKSGDKSEDGRGGSGDIWLVKLDAAGNKAWDKTLGGDRADGLYALQQTTDGGYILGGFSSSGIGGDKSEANRGGCEEVFCTNDFWVVKLDAAGNKEWDKTFGGEESEAVTALQQTPDGGYILGGSSASDVSGDKTGANRGSYDYWVVKLDAAGNKAWDKTYGSGGFEDLTSLQQTADGGYILGGTSASDKGGDKSEGNRGACSPVYCSNDYWVVKLDAAGNRQWDRTLGGQDSDQLYALQQTREGGYLLGGSSESETGGDKTAARRGASFDYWVVKLDGTGTKAWDQAYGGQGFEDLAALQQTTDGGYLLGGSSESQAGDDKTEANRGLCDPGAGCRPDFWVVKINESVAPPRITSFLPKKDVPGTVVTIRGRNFFTAWAVRFNGQDAAYEVVSDDIIKATVPVHATTGKITVSNAAGVAVSAGSFRVRHPGITAFSPAQGPVGTTVLLQGVRLRTTHEVYFGGVKATDFTVLSDSAVAAVVPEGALKGRIKVVLAGGGYGNSKTKFLVTPPEAVPVLAGQKVARQAVPATAGEELHLSVFPNPFYTQVGYAFSLPQAQPVVVKVLDLLGREVQVLYQGQVRARQAYQLTWRPGAWQPAGLYFIRLEAPGLIRQTKVLLAR